MAAAAIIIAFAFLAQPCVANRGHGALGILAQEDDSLPPPEDIQSDVAKLEATSEATDAEDMQSNAKLLLEDASNSTEEPRVFIGPRLPRAAEKRRPHRRAQEPTEEDPCNVPAKIPKGLRNACSNDFGMRINVASGRPLEIAMETDPTKTWPLLDKLARDDKQDVRRAAAGKPLVIAMEKEPNKTWPLLIKLVDDRSRIVRAAAAGVALEKAVETDPNKSWPVLAKLAQDGEWDVRCAAAGPALAAAVEKVPDRAFPLLVNLSEDDDSGVRAAAAGKPMVIAMEKEPNKTWPLLIKFAGDDSYGGSVRMAAAGSLAIAIKQKPDKVFPLLVNLTEDDYWKVREFAGGPPLAAAFDKKPNESLPLLRRLLAYQYNHGTNIRIAAAGLPLVAAFDKKPNESLHLLHRALGDPNWDVRAAAAGDALLEAVQHHMPLKDAEALIQNVTNDTAVEVVKSAGRAAAWVAKELAAESSRAKAKADEQATVAQEERVKAENAQAKSDKMLKIIFFLLIFLPVASIAAWNGRAWIADYRKRQRVARVQEGVDARLRARTRVSHKFTFVSADKIRSWQGGPLPHYQEMMAWGGWLHTKLWCLGSALAGLYNEQYIVISHRWYTPGHPDPGGDKVAALQAYLKKHPHVQYVWMDFWSLPQSRPGKPRTEEEDIEFKVGLANIFMLFIVGKILVLFDLQYQGRFWTSYELWLSMRTLTADGLMSTPADKRRVVMECMGAADVAQEENKQSMFQTWADKSPEDAAKVLAQDDILITNMKDKEEQMAVLYELAEKAGHLYQEAMAAIAQVQTEDEEGDLRDLADSAGNLNTTASAPA